jgi:hypothetical protein
MLRILAIAGPFRAFGLRIVARVRRIRATDVILFLKLSLLVTANVPRIYACVDRLSLAHV